MPLGFPDKPCIAYLVSWTLQVINGQTGRGHDTRGEDERARAVARNVIGSCGVGWNDFAVAIKQAGRQASWQDLARRRENGMRFSASLPLSSRVPHRSNEEYKAALWVGYEKHVPPSRPLLPATSLHSDLVPLSSTCHYLSPAESRHHVVAITTLSASATKANHRTVPPMSHPPPTRWLHVPCAAPLCRLSVVPTSALNF